MGLEMVLGSQRRPGRRDPADSGAGQAGPPSHAFLIEDRQGYIPAPLAG